MMDNLVRIYRQGGITGHHLVVQSLHRIDPQNPGLVLAYLPPEVLRQMLEFIAEFRQGPMITTHRILPTIDQVDAAKQWIETNRLNQSIASHQLDSSAVAPKPALPDS